MSLRGKGFYIWQVDQCQGGNVAQIVLGSQAAKLGHVLIKIANGAVGYNGNVRPLVEALQAAGIEVWGWQYIYGYNPLAEARMAIRRIRETGVTGFVVNAEKEYRDMVQPAPFARIYMQELRSGVGSNLPLALSSYRYPSLHSHFPFETFLEFCDLNMPQVYWLLSHNPVAQLERCVREYELLSVRRPIIPTGAAFRYGSWTPTAQEMIDFMQAAWDSGMNGANFWDWQHAERIPALWCAISEYEWPVGEDEDPIPPEIPEEEMGEVLDKLNQMLVNQETILQNQALILEKLDAEPVPEPEPEPEPEPDPEPEPLPDVYSVQVVVEKTNARWSKAKNDNGAPIMQIYPRDNAPVSERIQWFEDEFLAVLPGKIRADGGADYYQLTRGKGRNGETLYAKATDVMKTW